MADIAASLVRGGKSSSKKRGRPSNSKGDVPRKRACVRSLIPTKNVRADNTGHFPIWSDTQGRCKNITCINGFTKIMCVKKSFVVHQKKILKQIEKRGANKKNTSTKNSKIRHKEDSSSGSSVFIQCNSDKTGDNWAQCFQCEKWAHELCCPMDGGIFI